MIKQEVIDVILNHLKLSSVVYYPKNRSWIAYHHAKNTCYYNMSDTQNRAYMELNMLRHMYTLA